MRLLFMTSLTLCTPPSEVLAADGVEVTAVNERIVLTKAKTVVVAYSSVNTDSLGFIFGPTGGRQCREFTDVLRGSVHKCVDINRMGNTLEVNIKTRNDYGSNRNVHTTWNEEFVVRVEDNGCSVNVVSVVGVTDPLPTGWQSPKDVTAKMQQQGCHLQVKR